MKTRLPAVKEIAGRRGSSFAALVALAVVALVACQSVGDGSIPITAHLAPIAYMPSLTVDPPVLGVRQTAKQGELVLQFGPGTSTATAAAMGRRYGLELTGGPLRSGPMAPGLFTFTTPQADVVAVSPTTADVYFPTFLSSSDRHTYLTDHNLRLIRWVPIDDGRIALVRLPASQQRPTLIDPMQGLFHVALPAGLDQASVLQWAKTGAMRLIRYDPATGSTLVRPSALRPVMPSAYTLPARRANPTASLSRLYVQFTTGVSVDTEVAVAKRLGLVVISVGSANMAVLGGSRSTTNAAIQLLSDNPSVQCVRTSPNPCAISATPAGATSAAPPTYAQPSSVSISVVDGLLVVRWPAATGATAYAIFRTSSHAAPYELVAIVGGHAHDSYVESDQTAPGATVYYQIVALHPCTDVTDSSTCDVAVVSFGTPGAISAAWTNPVMQSAAAPAPTVEPAPTATPDPQASPSPNTTDQVTDPAATLVAPAVDPSPVAVAAPPEPPQPPAQTRVGPVPLGAPAGVSAAASDGHVTLDWQAVPGSASYRVYRSSGSGGAVYLATTSDTSFTDTSGAVNAAYTYRVAALAGTGLIGKLSDPAAATWQPSTSTPVVLRILPAEVGALAGAVRFQVDARSGDGRGHVDWRIDGAAAKLTLGTAMGMPSATAPLAWSAALTWNASSVPDGTYVVTTVVTGSSGNKVTLTSNYRVQSGAPIAPNSLSAVSKSGGVTLTWRQPSSATAVSYRLFRDQPLTASPMIEVSADRRSFVDTGALPGSHLYQLVAVDAGGRLSKPAAANVTVLAAAVSEPAAELDLQVLLPTGQPLAAGGRVTDRLLLLAPAASGLSFQLSSDGTSWSALPPDQVCAEHVCTLDLSTLSLAAGPYRVRATTPQATSAAYSFVKAEATRYPEPTSLTGLLTGMGVQLTWSAPAGTLPASYQISRRVQGGEWQLLDQVAGTAYVDSVAPVGTASDYRVSAVDPDGTAGSASSAVTVTIPSTELAELQAKGAPAAPSEVHATAAHGHAIVRWKPAAASDGYLVERQLAPTAAFAAVGTTSAAAYVDSPALAAGEITYRVIPLSGVVEGSASSGAVALVIPVSAPAPLSQSTQSMAARPAAPTTLTATSSAGSVVVSWKALPTSSPSSTYNVYRLDPATGVFVLAAGGLETPTFVDTGLVGPARFGYAVTASASSGSESLLSDPVWVNFRSTAPALTVGFIVPSTAQSSVLQAEALRLMAQVSAAAGIARVSFAIAPVGGIYKDLPTAPVDPRSPPPAPALGSGSVGLWGSTLNTTSLAPGAYRLRVRVSDRAGRSQQQVRDLVIAATGARGPPTYALSANPIAGGVHLQWSDPTSSTFIVQRSIFGADGPFETINSTQDHQYEDRSSVPGQRYWYRTLTSGANSSTSSVTAAIPMQPQVGAIGDQPGIQLGTVSQSELSVTVAPASTTHASNSTLRKLSGSYDLDATSLASGQSVHHLGELARITFQLPPGLSAGDVSSTAVYHWDDASASWIREASSVDSVSSTVTATVDHLSQFIVGLAAQPTSGGGSLAQPPAPPIVDGSQGEGSVLNPPSGPPPFQVAADGEVTSLRSEYGKVFENPDGTLTQTISTQPINYLDAAGAWQKIVTNLVPADTAGNYLRNAAGPSQLELPLAMATSPIRVTTASGLTTFGLEGAKLGTRVVTGSQATYLGVLSGVDATYSVLPSGLNEQLVISGRPLAPPVFTFDLSTGSLSLKQQGDGSVLAFNASGAVEYTIDAPWMHDAPTVYSEQGTVSVDVAVTLTGAGGSYRLTYTPDATWLFDPARLYPVTVDPSLTITHSGGNEDDVQINTLIPTGNYRNADYMPVGYTNYTGSPSGNGSSRGLLHFNGFLNDGYYASAATLKLYQYTNLDYGRSWEPNGTIIYAEAATRSWAYDTVTWNTGPTATTADDASATTIRCAAAPCGWLSWNVLNMVRAWETKVRTNYGIVLIADKEDGSGGNNNEDFYGFNHGSSVYPQLVITYDSYLYTSAVALATGSRNLIPNGGSSQVEVALANVGTATWGTERVSYRWWSGGVAITSYVVGAFMPYSVPGCAQPCTNPTTVVLRFALASPSITGTGPIYLQLAMANASISFSSVSWGSPSNACDQFYSASLNCNTGTAINLKDESATLAWQGPPQVLSGVAGSLLSIPITVTNTSTAAGRNYAWRAYNNADLIRVGIRDYRNSAGAVVPIANPPNLRTYLPGDVAPQASANLNAVIQLPDDPGDYLLRVDLVHEQPSSTVWFADQGNAPLEVRVRVVAPGDDKTTDVPMTLGDGTTLGINTTNGLATLSATDISIAERVGASLLVSRTYNGANGALSSVGTAVTSATYGLGWTFDFQRSLHLGSLGANTYDPSSGIFTDAEGRAWTLSWNAGRGLYEDAAGNRTVSPSSAQVTTVGSTLTVPGVRPVDLINGSGAIVADATAPGGFALKFETSGSPTALLLPSGIAPVQQNGTIEFWFKPNFDMSTDTGCHVFFADAQMRFGLAWNCPSGTYPWGSSVSRAIDFFTYDADTPAYDILSTAAITWTAASGWHHVSLTWAERGAKQLMTDTTLVSSPTHFQSPIADLVYGYQPNSVGTAFNYLNGRITQLRVDGRIVPGNGTSGELFSDAQPNTVLNASAANTLYLGHYDKASVQSSAGGYQLRNADQSIETYSPLGVLQSEADRFGNQIDYIWDSSGRIQTISDHAISGRTVNFTYNGTTVTATDFAGRSMTYQLNAAGDLISSTRSNQVPDPRTGTVSAQNATTTYSYAAGHLLQQVIDPRGAKTTVNYDQSYSQVVLVDNPTAYWRLGETSGSSAGDSAGTFTGSLHGTTTLGVGGALWGDSNPAYKFDGTSAYISVPYSSALNPTSFTVEAWVMVTGGQGTRRAVVSTAFPGTSNSTGFEIAASTTNIWMAQVGLGTASWGVVNGPAVVLNQWTYIVATYAANTLTLYVNGVSKTGWNLSTAYALNAARELDIGADYYATTLGGYLAGSVDEVSLSPSALSLGRIQSHFAAGRLGVVSNPSGYAAQVEQDSPLGYWRLGESSGPRAYDQSGASLNATYAGGYGLGQPGALTNDPATAASFDGSTGTAALNLTGIDTTSGHQVTVEFWMYWNGSTAGQMPFGFSLYDLYLNASGVGSLGFNTGNGDVYSISSVPANTWLHVAAVFTNGSVSSNKIYIDGAQQTLTQHGTPLSKSVTTAANVSGWSYNTSYKFAGNIQDLAVYNGALDPTRIQAHFSAGRAVPISGDQYVSAVMSDKPTGYWRLGETSGPTATDISGSTGNTGTYSGGYTLRQAAGAATEADSSTGFDGATGTVALNVGTIDTTAGHQVSVEFWMYWNGSTATQMPFGFNNDSLFLNYPSVGNIGFNTATSDVYGTSIPSLTWLHVVAVFTNGGPMTSNQLFINGVQMALTQLAGTPTNRTVTAAANISGWPTNTSYKFSGFLDDVAIYNGALSPGRVYAHYLAARLAPSPITGLTGGSYAATVVASTPVGFWRLDEASGTTALDKSRYNNRGTYSATGVTLGQAGSLATDAATAAMFNGTAGNVQVSTSASLNVAGPLTIEAWIKKSTQTTGPIVEFNNGTTPGVQFWNYSTWDSLFANFVDTAGASHIIQSAAGLFKTGLWYQVAATYDGTYAALYVNGLQVARSNLGSFTPQTSYTLYIARRPASTYFAGTIDDVAIFPTALTASTIQAQYNAAWDASRIRVATIQDARGTTADRFYYNDEAATTEVFNAIGLPSFYTFQPYGGRTLSVTDTGNNVTRYEFDPAASYRLTAVISPSGLRHSYLMNVVAPVGQQEQTLLEDDSAQPSTSISALMSGAIPDPIVYGPTTLFAAGEAWIWDASVELKPGVLSHKSTGGVAGLHEHYLQFGWGTLIPAGTRVNQWVFVEPTTQLPSELQLQFRDASGWTHAAYWGTFNASITAATCPTNCPQGAMPAAGRWVQLTVSLGPSLGAGLTTTTLTTALTSGSVYTSLAVAGSHAFIAAGSTITIGYGTSTSQNVIASANAAVNSTTISVTSFTANANYATSTPIGAFPPVDVDMAGKTMTGVRFTVYGGTGSVWWGPTSLESPGANVTDPIRTITRYAYNSANDMLASVDANGIASVRDIDLLGLVRTSSTGVEPAAPIALFQDPVNALGTSAWQQEFGYSGTSAAAVGSPQHGITGSVNQTHTANGLQSDLYRDFAGLAPGTMVRVSVWVQTNPTTGGSGGASLVVDNHLMGALLVQRRSGSVQAAANQWVQLTLPFVVDGSGQIRVHLWQESFAGTTIWADLRVEDMTPAPDFTLSHPLSVYATGFENSSDTSWALGSAIMLADTSQSHAGQSVVKDSSAATNTVSRTLALTANATYRVTVWVRTVVSGHSVTNGAQLCATFGTAVCTPLSTTEGQWQQLQVNLTGSGSLTIQLTHQTWAGDVYWDDATVEELPGKTPAGSGPWQGTAWAGTDPSGTATWTASSTGGVGGGPSRQVSTPGGTDVQDALATTALRANASYVISIWASSSVANTTISFWLGSPTAMDRQPATCVLQTSPTLCQNSLTFTGGDRAPTNLVVDYGTTAVTFNISHPLIALNSQVYDYTTYGQVTSVHDVFGHSSTIALDSNSLYPTQTVVIATPSPNLTTNTTYNSLGQLTLSTRLDGAQSIAEQLWVDSWGRRVGDVANCVVAVAPPGLCNAAPDAATNVMTRYAYDLDGDLIDRYEQGQAAGSWIDTHFVYDALNNQVARIDNCVTTTNPCDAASNVAQNIVSTTAYDILNRPTDTYAPLPGCAPTSASCVPQPACNAGPPPTCAPPSSPCPITTCVDTHSLYDTSGRLFQNIANYGGTGDASTANLTTQVAYNSDSLVTDPYVPVTGYAGATLMSGQVSDHGVYDVLGRLVSDIRANSVPTWMASTTKAQTDYTLDAGGRVISATGPGTGSSTATNRILTNTDYDDLGRALSVAVDPTPGLNAKSTTVYDPRGHLHTWTPATQAIPTGGLETTQNFDLAGHLTSVVKDDDPIGLKLTTTTAYDGYGRATDVTDPLGIVTHTTYDALNRLLSVTQNYCPIGNSNPNCTGDGILADQNVTTSYVYDLAGNQTQAINARGIIQLTAYDPLHRTTSVTQSCQNPPPASSCGTQTSDQNVLASQAYDQAGDVLTTTDPLMRLNVYTFDALGRKASQTVNCTSYNSSTSSCNGSPVTSGQNLTTLWQYDAKGQVLKETSPRQCTTTAPCFNGVSITDGVNLATSYTYDGLFRLASVTEDSGHSGPVTAYGYDPSGNLLTQTVDPGNSPHLNHVTAYTIDNLSRTIKVTDPSNRYVQTNYNQAGEIVSTVNARLSTNTNTLDRVGRLSTVSYSRADGTPALQSFGYDDDGNRNCFSDGTSCTVNPTTITYDHLNRPISVVATAPFGTTTYSYFMDGAVNTIADANGTTTFAADRLGRVATMVTPLIAGTTSYVYDASGRLTSRTEANGLVTAVSYTGTDQLASKTETTSPANGSLQLASWSSVTYDLNQNRTAETLIYYAGNPFPDPQSGNTASTYQYDGQDQLSQAALPLIGGKNYVYDSAHNLTTNGGSPQTYNSNESLNTACAVTFTPDADGNLNQDCNSNALGWNSLSQLEKYSTTEVYTYDALGRITTVTNPSSGIALTKFVYQGLTGQVVQELDGGNNLVRSYAWDGSRQLYTKSGSNAYYEITNPHGDVVAYATATGLAGTQHFDPWGNLTNAPSGTSAPFGFQGAIGSWTDATTGFVSMGFRWYYPRTAQFLSSDPEAGTADQRTPMARDRWLYVVNNPLIHLDPSGLNCDDRPCGKNGLNNRKFHDSPQVCDAACRKRVNAPRYFACGKGMCQVNPVNTTCNIGRQSCGTFAQHFGNQLLNIACGLTVCPAIQSAQDTYMAVTDWNGYMQKEQARSDAAKAYWSEVYDTYQRAANAHVGPVPIGWIPGVPEALFGMKWSADRLDDFDKDPGTASANISVFVATLAIPGPKLVRAPEAGGLTPVVIGQGMDRVEFAANALAADYYKGVPFYKAIKTVLPDSVAKKIGAWDNTRWLNRVMNAGRTIIDVGPEDTPRLSSWNLEADLIAAKAYTNVIKVWGVIEGMASGVA